MTLVPSRSSIPARPALLQCPELLGIVTPSSFSCCLGDTEVNMCLLTDENVFPLEAQKVA